ncbi:MAG: extracellular solute-binding protein [Lachnospiraceae bacterium]|nr:extracellular solute-binding protein [Lachnospiraceae bacterium]
MKFKKVLSLVLISAMTCSLAACSGSTTTTSQNNADTVTDNTDTDKAADADNAAEPGTAAGTADADTTDGDVKEADLSDIIPDETVTLTVYSQLSNYEGEQIGWFADIMKEKFNVKLNIISNGDGVFDTRMESGNLGDIVLFGSDGDEYTRAYQNGMLFDWNEDDILSDYGPYIKSHMADALDKNAAISDGTVYGFGFDVASGAGQYGEFDYHPDIRYDLYKQIGSPEINELEDYVDVLKQMKEACPTSDSGKETYGVSLFKDWDGNMVMFVKATATNFFGLDEFQFGFYDADTGAFEDCLQEGGHYERCLKFYNTLYQQGLLDPDSMTQGYDGCMEDYQDGGAFFCIFNWMGATQYNTNEHMAEGKKLLPVAAKNQDTLVYGLGQSGSNRIWSIGAKSQYPELCMAIINYLCTPEGRLDYEYGPQGVCWEWLDNGKAELTDFGLDCKALAAREDKVMPAPYSGLWDDGCPQMNNTTWSLNTTIPDGVDGQTFNFKYWDKYLSLDVDKAEQEWRADMGVDSYTEYMTQFDYSISLPHSYAESIKSDELATTWEQVKTCIQNGSWQAIYAKDDSEFESIVAKMRADADSYGYQECIEWCENEAALRKAAEYE